MNKIIKRMAAVLSAVTVIIVSSVTAVHTKAYELSDEEFIWYYLKEAGLSDQGAAGLMGNLYAESGLKPNNLQGAYESKLGHTDASYTAAIDNGSYTYDMFINDHAGYGLAQWTYWSRKANLYNFISARGTSISDLEAQLDFLMNEIQNTTAYASVWETLKTATTVCEASNKVLFDFESPSDQSTTVQNKRANYSMVYYNRYAGTYNPLLDEVSSEKDGIVKVTGTTIAFTGFEPRTDVADALLCFENSNYLEIRDSNGDVAGPKDVVCTGFTVNAVINGEVTASYPLVVNGDLSCDGVINSADCILMKLQIKGDASVSPLLQLAGDYDGSGGISTTDYICLVRLIKSE